MWLNDEDHIEHRTVTLNLKIPVPDSTTVDHREVTIAYTQKVPVEHLIRGGTNLALNIVQMFFSGWERHEMDEWFRLDGKMIRDPHAGDTQ